MVGASPSTETACSRLLLAGTQLTTADLAAISVTFRLLGLSDDSAYNKVIANVGRNLTLLLDA